MTIIAEPWGSFAQNLLQHVIQWGSIILLSYVGLQLKPFLTKTIREKKAEIRKAAFWFVFVLAEVCLYWSMASCGAQIYLFRHHPPTSFLSQPGMLWLLMGLTLVARLWNFRQTAVNGWNSAWVADEALKAEVEMFNRIKSRVEAKQPLTAEELSAATMVNMRRFYSFTNAAILATKPGSRMLAAQVINTVIAYWIAFYFILIV